jgi:hypothetical protein
MIADLLLFHLPVINFGSKDSLFTIFVPRFLDQSVISEQFVCFTEIQQQRVNFYDLLLIRGRPPYLLYLRAIA